MASAERNVKVVPEPSGERDVPPPSEFGDRAGDVRVVEVFQKVEPEHAAQANRHVGVTGEVEIDLQRVAQHAEPRPCRVAESGWQKSDPP